MALFTNLHNRLILKPKRYCPTGFAPSYLKVLCVGLSVSSIDGCRFLSSATQGDLDIPPTRILQTLPLFTSLCLSFHLFSSLCLSLSLFASLYLSLPPFAYLCLSLPFFASLCLPLPSFAFLASLSLFLPLSCKRCSVVVSLRSVGSAFDKSTFKWCNYTYVT